MVSDGGVMVNGLPPFGVNVGFGSAIKTSFIALTLARHLRLMVDG
jgi:hypothetical protein